MIKSIDIRLKRTSGFGLLHDSRGDIQTLTKVCNALIDKVNELTDKINELESKGTVKK